MSLEKRMFDIGKKAATSIALVSMLTFAACKDDSNNPPPTNPPTNQAPDTVIGKDFGDNGVLTGMVDYTVCGTDSDGYVNHIDLWTNGVYSQAVNTFQEKPFCTNFSEPIIIGENTLVAKAVDNEGLEDPNEATSFFNVNPPVNNAPETTISATPNRENLDYIVCASDLDGYVDRIDVWANGVYSQKINTAQAEPFCTNFAEPIIVGDNTLEAMAIDNDGLSDPSKAINIFDSITENQKPTTTITRDFNTGFSGNVDYTFCGADPDQGDHINYIDTIVNGVSLRYTSPDESNPYCETASFSIQAGTNSAQATASDSNGVDDPIGATDSFDSPTKGSILVAVEEELISRGYIEGVDYQKNFQTDYNGTPVIHDFRIIDTETSSTKAGINYNDSIESLDTSKVCAVDFAIRPYVWGWGIPENTFMLKVRNLLDNFQDPAELSLCQ